jgi:hypothetical protein
MLQGALEVKRTEWCSEMGKKNCKISGYSAHIHLLRNIHNTESVHRGKVSSYAIKRRGLCILHCN